MRSTLISKQHIFKKKEIFLENKQILQGIAKHMCQFSGICFGSNFFTNAAVAANCFRPEMDILDLTNPYHFH